MSEAPVQPVRFEAKPASNVEKVKPEEKNYQVNKKKP